MPNAIRAKYWGMMALISLSTALCVTLFTPRTAQAEGLLYTVTCDVTGLLGRQCAKEEKVTPPTSNAPTKEAPSTSSGSGVTPPPAQSSTVIQPQPLAVEPELLTPLPNTEATPAPLVMQRASTTRQFAFVFPSVSRDTGQAVLGAQNAPIRPSQMGWVIFGAPWYFWLTIAGLAGAAVYIVYHRVARPFIAVISK